MKKSKAREVRKEIFADTKSLYESDERLVASVDNSRKKHFADAAHYFRVYQIMI